MLSSYLTKTPNPALQPTVSVLFHQAKAAAELARNASSPAAHARDFLIRWLTLFNANSGIHDLAALSWR